MMKKIILALGLAIIFLIFCMIGFYELREKQQKVDPVVDSDEQDETNILDGYEEQEDLIRYMVYQIQNENLEGALRGCAIQDLAEYFTLEAYVRYLSRFEEADLLPPSDAESPAYQAIAKAELAKSYSVVLKKILKIQKKKGTLEFIGLKEDVPENPDGKYYQNQEMVCEILGARSVSEFIIYLSDEDQVYELHCTLARYKKYWKMLMFHGIQDSGIEELDLRVCAEERSEPISLDEYADIVLPRNYDILNDCKEEDPVYMIQRFFLYLQREDALSALSYMDIYRDDGSSYDDGTDTMFRRQGVAAENLQEFYYRILLLDDTYYDWILRDLDDRSSELVTQLSTTNMLFTNLRWIQEEKNDGEKAVYKVRLLYNYEPLLKRVYLIHRTDGWKIQAIR